MDRDKLIQILGDSQISLLKITGALIDIERDLTSGQEKLFKLSTGDIAQLEEGYTITVIGNGTAIRLQMRGAE